MGNKEDDSGLDPYLLHLIEIISEELKDVPPHPIDSLYAWLCTVFELWKLEHGEEPKGQGLLGWNRPPFDEAKPYQCAGHGVRNNIDLAYELHHQKYQKFEDILEKVPMEKVLVVLVYKEPNNQTLDSLTHVITLLHQLNKIDKTFAWEKIKIYAPDAEKWKDHTSAQKKRAAEPRGPLSAIVETLIINNPDDITKELWSRFLGSSDKDFKIREVDGGAEWSEAKSGQEGSLTYGSFAVLVSRIKKRIAGKK